LNTLARQAKVFLFAWKKEEVYMWYVIQIEGTFYGPFTEEEHGEFCLDYEASFEFFPKPPLTSLQLVKISGGSAAELHIPPPQRVK
jgi:hypothetical protein